MAMVEAEAEALQNTPLSSRNKSGRHGVATRAIPTVNTFDIDCRMIEKATPRAVMVKLHCHCTGTDCRLHKKYTVCRYKKKSTKVEARAAAYRHT